MVPAPLFAADSETLIERRSRASTLQWLLDLLPYCPSWQGRWTRVSYDLTHKGRAHYRNLLLVRKRAGIQVGAVGRQHDAATTTLARDDETLFRLCHQDLAALIDALPCAHKKGTDSFESLSKVVLAQFPSDAPWVRAMNYRIGMARRVILTSKHDPANYPRILAPRRSSLALVKSRAGAWKSSRGASIKVILKNSHSDRREFIQALLEIPGLESIEIPTDVDFRGAADCAAKISKALSSKHKTAAQARMKGRTWSLALRRIRGVGLRGCFDAATQTVIVDPRHLDSLKHEICHWLLDHSIGRMDANRLQRSEQEVHRLMGRLFPRDSSADTQVT